jgi:hypothetical protein
MGRERHPAPGRRRAVGVGMAVYRAKAILLGKVGDVWKMLMGSIP